MATKKVLFEKSRKDVEIVKHGKEGSRKEEAFDKKQMLTLKKGGKVAKKPSCNS